MFLSFTDSFPPHSQQLGQNICYLEIWSCYVYKSTETSPHRISLQITHGVEYILNYFFLNSGRTTNGNLKTIIPKILVILKNVIESSIYFNPLNPLLCFGTSFQLPASWLLHNEVKHVNNVTPYQAQVFQEA